MSTHADALPKVMIYKHRRSRSPKHIANVGHQRNVFETSKEVAISYMWRCC